MEIFWWSRVRAFLGSRIFRTLMVLVVIVACYTVVVNKVEHLIFDEELNFAATLSGFLGLAMSLLMVYRTNGAYDRWWEGRKVWGQLVNDCRNLVVKSCTLTTASVEEKKDMQRLVAAFPPLLTRSPAGRTGRGLGRSGRRCARTEFCHRACFREASGLA